MRVATWNMAQRNACWAVLETLAVDFALLQEAPSPPVDLTGFLHTEDFEPIRAWRTAIWSRKAPLRPLEPTTSRTAPPWRRGVAAVAEFDNPAGGTTTLLSLHAVDDKHTFSTRKDPRGYAVSTLHHALSDLTGYLDDRSRRGHARGHGQNRLIAGGDLNINPGWDREQRNPSHQVALDRIAAFGLSSVLEVREDDALATCIRTSRPIRHRQIDYLFASHQTNRARVLDTTEIRATGSDHLPVVAEVG